MVGSNEQCTEPLGFMNDREYSDQVSDCQLLKKDFALMLGKYFVCILFVICQYHSSKVAL